MRRCRTWSALTWQGVALHAGNLPGYPASHGCVRLPLEFAKLLFGVTTLGTPVIVADRDVDRRSAASRPADLRPHRGMAREAVKRRPRPSRIIRRPPPSTAAEAVSFLISTADRKLIAFVNGKESVHRAGRR